LVPIAQEAGWAPGLVWPGEENLPLTGFEVGNNFRIQVQTNIHLQGRAMVNHRPPTAQDLVQYQAIDKVEVWRGFYFFFNPEHFNCRQYHSIGVPNILFFSERQAGEECTHSKQRSFRYSGTFDTQVLSQSIRIQTAD